MADVTKILRIKGRSSKDIGPLLDRVKNQYSDYKESGDSLRLITCPLCHNSHPRNPAFSININSGGFYCHDCEGKGHISNLFETQTVKSLPKKEKPSQVQTQKEITGQADEIYKSLSVVGEKSKTGRYLLSRGIHYSTWSDFDWPLKEDSQSFLGPIAVYPFITESEKIAGIQRVFINESGIKTGRFYADAKSQGVGLLKDSSKIIVAEGLETGLSVRQHLGHEWGLIVCGDCNGLKKLAGDHSWAIDSKSKILIAADNDSQSQGIKAARLIYWRFHKKALIYMPSLPGLDWNDVLIQKRMEEEWI